MVNEKCSKKPIKFYSTVRENKIMKLVGKLMELENLSWANNTSLKDRPASFLSGVDPSFQSLDFWV